MEKKKYPKEFLEHLEAITGKRSRFVIDKILENGHVTTEELENAGYNHAPRAAADVRDQGIPLVTNRVVSSKGRRIAAYTFGDIDDIRSNILHGRKVFPKKFKNELMEVQGQGCAICKTPFELLYLQIDHKVPYMVSGEPKEFTAQEFMLLCSSCNRSKSWSCEKCENWQTIRNIENCQSCYWANPSEYSHIALQEIRRLDLQFTGEDAILHDQIAEEAEQYGVTIQDYIIDKLKK